MDRNRMGISINQVLSIAMPKKLQSSLKILECAASSCGLLFRSGARPLIGVHVRECMTGILNVVDGECGCL